MNRLLVLFFLLLIGIFCAVCAADSFKEGQYKEGILWIATFVAGCMWLLKKPY